MKKLLDTLNHDFVRISSQHAVNMNHVEKFTSSSVFLNGEELKIGSSYRSLFSKSKLI